MANNWKDYILKKTVMDEDDFLICDSENDVNKRVYFSSVLNWIMGKLFDAKFKPSKPQKSEKESPIISFIDDDCKSETYDKLFKLIKSMNIPYAVACPPDQVGTYGYMTTAQLEEMRSTGVDVMCHHLKQYNMDQFANKADYESELSACDERFKKLGIQAKGICYPQGVYVDDYMDAVSNHYSYGFTVDRGVNEIPLESFFLKRVEVFPTSEIYTFDDVKRYVDRMQDGEWLVFMTHSWYGTFDIDKLKELIQYIKAKGISIVGIDEALSRVGNIVEHGIIKKPLEYMSSSFYCVDAIGGVHTNSQKFYQKSNEKLSRVTAGYNAGYNLSVNGKTITTTDKKRLVSEKVTVTSGESYLVSASNIYGNALYVIYDGSDAVLSYEASENTANGTVMKDKKITVPDKASYMRISSNLSIQPESYDIKKLTLVDIDRNLMDETLEKSGVPADGKATGDAMKGKANGEGITFSINENGGLQVTFDDET